MDGSSDMKKLSDYFMELLVNQGVSDVFMVSGGGMMHLVDSMGANKKIRYISCHHEQACTIAAEAYGRTKGSIGVAIVTTGPGGTNAITGVASAWVDSIPMLVISGQVRTQIMADYSKLRQMAPQEINIVDLVKPVTKYAKVVMDPTKIRYELEKAIYLANDGRPGPVWLDIPLDVQGAMIETTKLTRFTPPIPLPKLGLKLAVKKVREQIAKSERPVLILGHGVRLSHAIPLLPSLIKKLKMPILLPYNGLDLVEENNQYLQGKFGPMGSRKGNFALQNSDLILSIGASLNLTSIGFDLEGFAPRAKIIAINIDPAELTKSTLRVDLPIVTDAKVFIKELLEQTAKQNFSYSSKWIKACKNWREKYPVILPEFFNDKKHVNTYVFFDKLSKYLKSSDVLVTGVSLDSVGMYQALKIKKGLRAFTNKNFGGMGWCLPAGLGAVVANQNNRSILVTGDGSIQFNIQELGTISAYKLGVKIFVFNNKGYESIKTMQENHFQGRYVGAESGSGVTNPDFKKLAESYDIKYAKIRVNDEIDNVIKKVLSEPGPVLCEIRVSPDQHRIPRASSFKRPDGTMESRPLEDMWPFLPREEITANMSMFEDSK